MSTPLSKGILSKGTVGRAIFQSNLWKRFCRRGKGSAPAQLFMDNKSPVEISVFILNLAPDEELAQIGDNMASQRGENRKFYGWAELSVTDAGKGERKVRTTPQPQNKWHADIILPPTAKVDETEQERHAIELANMAVPRSKPTSRQ